MSVSSINQELVAKVREAVLRLSSPREMDGRVLIDLPIMYPSGALVVVQIQQSADKILVSDMGHGLIEAELMAADSHYPSAASKAAADYAVKFDGYAIFALWVPVSRIESAIVSVANASSRAAIDAVAKASEVRARDQNERIYERVREIFGARKVSKKQEIIGKHSAWEAHNVIITPNKSLAVFEYMTGHQVSVSSKFFMFSDIRSSNPDISLNAVVKSMSELTEKTKLITDVANIVPVDAPADLYRRYAEAA